MSFLVWVSSAPSIRATAAHGFRWRPPRSSLSRYGRLRAGGELRRGWLQAAARAFMEKTQSSDGPKSSALATGAPTQYWFAEVDKLLNSEVDGDEELEMLYEFAQQQSRNERTARALVMATATASERPWEDVGKHGAPFLDKKAREEQSRRLNERIDRIQLELKQQKDQEQRAKVWTMVQVPRTPHLGSLSHISSCGREEEACIVRLPPEVAQVSTGRTALLPLLGACHVSCLSSSTRFGAPSLVAHTARGWMGCEGVGGCDEGAGRRGGGEGDAGVDGTRGVPRGQATLARRGGGASRSGVKTPVGPYSLFHLRSGLLPSTPRANTPDSARIKTD